MYCTQCNTNWEKLYSYEEGDESYEFCPTCYTDMHLVERKENQPSFVACKFTGKHFDPKTGKERLNEKIEPPPFNRKKVWIKPKFRTVPARNI